MTTSPMQTGAPVRSQNLASGTAEIAAFARALASREPDRSVRGPDRLAGELLSAEWRARLRYPAWMGRWQLERVTPGTYYYVLARTRHVDQALLQALAGGTRQVVILGAGFDTRAARLEKSLGGVQVFEVDDPGAQVVKKFRWEEALGGLPDNVAYVPLDLEGQPLAEALQAAGYQTHAKTFFIWEGVSYYLSPAAVDAVLNFAAHGCGMGSAIVFDYALESFVRGERLTAQQARVRPVYAAAGEPLRFGIGDGRSGAFLQERGLRLLSDLGPAELEQLYLTRKNGRRYGRPSDYVRIALAANG